MIRLMVLAELPALDVAAQGGTLTRVEEFGGGVSGGSGASMIWADFDASPILIVGAMAVSPDLLAITATAVGLIQTSRLSQRRLDESFMLAR
jgi:hypothetical protein